MTTNKKLRTVRLTPMRSTSACTTACLLARETAGLPPNEPIELTVFPREKGLAGDLYDRLTGNEHDNADSGATALGRAIETVQPVVQRIEALLDGGGLVMMSPLSQPH